MRWAVPLVAALCLCWSIPPAAARTLVGNTGLISSSVRSLPPCEILLSSKSIMPHHAVRAGGQAERGGERARNVVRCPRRVFRAVWLPRRRRSRAVRFVAGCARGTRNAGLARVFDLPEGWTRRGHDARRVEAAVRPGLEGSPDVACTFGGNGGHREPEIPGTIYPFDDGEPSYIPLLTRREKSEGEDRVPASCPGLSNGPVATCFRRASSGRASRLDVADWRSFPGTDTVGPGPIARFAAALRTALWMDRGGASDITPATFPIIGRGSGPAPEFGRIFHRGSLSPPSGSCIPRAMPPRKVAATHSVPGRQGWLTSARSLISPHSIQSAPRQVAAQPLLEAGRRSAKSYSAARMVPAIHPRGGSWRPGGAGARADGRSRKPVSGVEDPGLASASSEPMHARSTSGSGG